MRIACDIRSVMSETNLTDKQRRFIDEYLVDLNGTQAVLRSGYSTTYNAASVSAHHLLSNPKIFSEIMRRQEERQKRTEVTQDRVIEELARIAFFDIRRIYDEDGKLLPIHKLPDDVAAAIGGLDVITSTNDGDFIDTKKIKLIDKKGSLELLGKHMMMFTDKVNINHSGTLNLADAVRQRDAKTDK